MNAPEFHNKRALVTGGTKGIGESIVRLLAQRGATVITSARKAPANPLAGVRYLQADVATLEGANAVVDVIKREFGGLDLLVNNVGGLSAPTGGALALTDTDWKGPIQTNLMSAVTIDRAFLPRMVAQGSGAIVHITSIQRRFPLYESTVAYAAQKPCLQITVNR